MNEFEKLALSTETIRDLTSEDLARVAGGAARTDTCLTILGGETGTFLCPSGHTWTANCNGNTATCA